MKVFITLLLLWLGFCEDCTDKNVRKNLDLLGSPSYRIRESAQRQLVMMKKPPVRFIERSGQIAPDPEVSVRCNRLFNQLTDFNTEPFGIWDIPNDIRFPLGFKGEGDDFVTPLDLSQHYYKKARDAKDPSSDVWRDSEIGQEALKMLFVDLRRGGWSKENVSALLEDTKVFFKQHYWETDFYDFDCDWQKKVPGIPVKTEPPKKD